MKLLGMIGGVGPESTIEYYRAIFRTYRERRPDGSAPPLIINSVDLSRLLKWMAAGDFASVTDYLVEEIDRLARAGADFGLISANTPHIVFDEIRKRVSLPLISIVEATATAAKSRGMKKLGIFGTRYTMTANFYPEVVARNGISVVAPDSAQRDYIHEIYLGDLVAGIIRPETRQRLIEIAMELKRREGIDGLILGGTELPLILQQEHMPELPLLDTTVIHARAAVDRILQ